MDRKMMEEIDQTFASAFGKSGIEEGMRDVLRQATEYSRASSFEDMKTELGHLLASVLQRANEFGLSPEKLVQEALNTIKARSAQYSALGRKINVALLLGAFDPITVGHIQNARNVLNTTNGSIDEVWLVPAYSHLFGKKMVAPEHRLEMCRLASAVDARIKVCDYEIKNRFGGETNFMVKCLKRDFSENQYDFSIVIGQDNANGFKSWSNHQELEKSIKFIVCPRPGCQFDASVAWYMKPPHVYLPDSLNLREISSTKIRIALHSIFCNDELSEQQKSENIQIVQDFLHPDVLSYIKEHRLYA